MAPGIKKQKKGEMMGTYYALGVVVEFTARTEKAFPKEKWETILKERFDIELFNIVIQNKSIQGSLKEGVFRENIADLFQKLKNITMDENIGYYFTQHGNEIEKYSKQCSNFYIIHERERIKLRINFAVLFIEGKVLVEEFNIEPQLMNWLFRHINLGNKLSGAIMSGIIG